MRNTSLPRRRLPRALATAGVLAISIAGLAACDPPVTRIIEDSAVGNPGFAFSAAWTLESSDNASGGTRHTSSTAGATATIRFTGSALRLYGVKAPWQGKASVSIDGAAPVTIDEYAPSWTARNLLFSSPTLPNTAHTAAFKVLGTKQAASTWSLIEIDFAQFDATLSAPSTTITTPRPTTPPATTTTPSASTSLQRVFAPSSFWYQDVSGAPVASDSAQIASDAVRQMRQYYGSATRTYVGINTTAYAAPIYTAGPNDPKVNVAVGSCDGSSYVDPGLRQQFTGVPIPTWAQPADGTDSEMVVYSPTENRIWEFWVAKKVNNSWSACWGGRMDNVSSNPGIFADHYGTTATGLPFMGGQITTKEMTDAKNGMANAIPHAIGISFVELSAGHYWPAQRDDGGYYNPGNSPIQEGRRFRINPSLNIDALNLNPIPRAIAKAGQKYGFVVWDKAGAVSVRADNPKPLTLQGKPNPYPSLFSPKDEYSVLDGIPWTGIQALPQNYGQP